MKVLAPRSLDEVPENAVTVKVSVLRRLVDSTFPRDASDEINTKLWRVLRDSFDAVLKAHQQFDDDEHRSEAVVAIFGTSFQERNQATEFDTLLLPNPSKGVTASRRTWSEFSTLRHASGLLSANMVEELQSDTELLEVMQRQATLELIELLETRVDLKSLKVVDLDSEHDAFGPRASAKGVVHTQPSLVSRTGTIAALWTRPMCIYGTMPVEKQAGTFNITFQHKLRRLDEKKELQTGTYDFEQRPSQTEWSTPLHYANDDVDHTAVTYDMHKASLDQRSQSFKELASSTRGKKYKDFGTAANEMRCVLCNRPSHQCRDLPRRTGRKEVPQVLCAPKIVCFLGVPVVTLVVQRVVSDAAGLSQVDFRLDYGEVYWRRYAKRLAKQAGVYPFQWRGSSLKSSRNRPKPADEVPEAKKKKKRRKTSSKSSASSKKKLPDMRDADEYTPGDEDHADNVIEASSKIRRVAWTNAQEQQLIRFAQENADLFSAARDKKAHEKFRKQMEKTFDRSWGAIFNKLHRLGYRLDDCRLVPEAVASLEDPGRGSSARSRANRPRSYQSRVSHELLLQKLPHNTQRALKLADMLGCVVQDNVALSQLLADPAAFQSDEALSDGIYPSTLRTQARDLRQHIAQIAHHMRCRLRARALATAESNATEHEIASLKKRINELKLALKQAEEEARTLECVAKQKQEEHAVELQAADDEAAILAQQAHTLLTQVMLPTTPPVAASAQTGNDVASLASSTKVSASSADSDGNSADDAASTTST